MREQQHICPYSIGCAHYGAELDSECNRDPSECHHFLDIALIEHDRSPLLVFDRSGKHKVYRRKE